MSLDASILLTATLAALACTVPGVWLVLRRQSMLGDALSHTVLPGIVIAFLAITAAAGAGWISPGQAATIERLALLAGAVAAGVGTAWLTEWLSARGVEGNAALGVVFTSLFALGLFLVRFAVDDVHLDTDCVLFGRLVDTALDTQPLFGWDVPRAAVASGLILLVNLLLLALAYKELRIAAFDPGLAATQGYSPRLIHYAHLTVTAITAVGVFEAVGSVLVVALLVVPAATAQLLTTRLNRLIPLALLLAIAAAIGGHWLSQTLPALIFQPLGYPQIEDASTAGMIAVASGLLFVAAWVASPSQGLLAGAWNRAGLALRILAEDMLGALYRQSERFPEQGLSRSTLAGLSRGLPGGPLWTRLLLRRFTARRLITRQEGEYRLTPLGLAAARKLVRGHRLWESYVNRYFDLPPSHLDSSAHRAEHYLDDELRDRLAEELHTPPTDPHGSEIPG